MRRLFGAVLLAAALVISGTGPVAAAPVVPAGPGAALPDGWFVAGGKLGWRAERQVPAGDAAVEFWSGERRLGVPAFTADHTTFTLDLSRVFSLADLSVRTGGRRLDRVEALPRRTAAPTPSPAPTLPATTTDPGVKGKFKTISGGYALSSVTLPDYPEPVEMEAVVVAPKGATGPRPLALFLHGRHPTCYSGDDWTMQWPCSEGTQPIPSHRGYLQAQELLASQGWITVSISANGINGQDAGLEDAGAQGRSSLVREHLARWADWSGTGRAGAPAIVRSAPRADMGQVFLMGHSRGGEGVNRAAMDSLTPPPGDRIATRWTIRGLMLIGPTIFGHDPVPDVPSVTILPGCDGDVADLQGQMFVDATRGVGRGRALHSALFMIGANHNYFNTEWTPGQAVAFAFDDWAGWDPDDPVCGTGAPTRLTAAQQQDAGVTYIAAAARLFTGEDRMRPLLDGSGVRAPSAGPARVLSHALGGNRVPALLPDPATVTGGGARICALVSGDDDRCLAPRATYFPSVHGTPFRNTVPEPGRWAADVSWSSAGTPLTLAPARPVSLGDSRDLALRLIVPPESTGTRFGVTIVDTAGRRTVLGDAAADGLPAGMMRASYWAQELRVPLGGFRGRMAGLELTPRTASGQAWLLDAWGYRPGTPDPRPVALPRVDIGGLTVTEGDTGSVTYQVPVRISGGDGGGGRLRLAILDRLSGGSVTWQATVAPGTGLIEVPVDVPGDTLYGEGEAQVVLAKAEQGLVVGDYTGVVNVLNDDPMPVVTVAPVTDTVAEGGTLTWRATLSTRAEAWIPVDAWAVPPADGTELSTRDVDPDWLWSLTGREPDPELPLSGADVFPYTFVEPGEISADLTVPTITDDVAEGPETVELEFGNDLGTFRGTVTD
ncbi:hypothetical protein [Actinoplanes sp. NBRC 101535]|uniref:alpha/beta hydrolase family protein n=1 Tax=Actinoplanes sp. NBRC 101535 TaxID=3032196 RepID=UPI0024A58627|nr:hypothetical protein [Actinoplanes sp. NBRC 101535]GLY04092.1 hypothetical protein Acsp01_44710 [Actinoplanes sp. NBRC 101535]